MLKLSEAEIVERIEQGEHFECELIDGSFSLKIDSYVPTICTAIHAGHKLRPPLHDACLLSEEERLYEEDPYTDQLIHAMPITLLGMDSRYEYDLNRPVARCIYQKAWGKTVWQRKLTSKERSISIAKHQTFYRVLDALINALEQRFGAALVVDLHSYNHLRHENLTPTFNIGTEQVDLDRWSNIITHSLKKLAKITLPNMPVQAEENHIFFGRGYMISHINSRFQNTLVIPLEIKKVFMDELSGEPYPLVMQSLSEQFKDYLTDVSAFFARRFTRKRRARQTDMLTETLEPSVLQVDRALFKLAKELETLYYINPINIETERKAFFKHNGNYQPQFHYRQLDIDPYKFREQLYRLPVDRIRDPNIQSLYRDVINSYSEKIGLLVNAGKPEFLYESLKYYGEPTTSDEKNAHFLLHAAHFESVEDLTHTTDQLISEYSEYAKQWHMNCKIKASSKLVASAMVSNSRRTLFVAKGLELSKTEAMALLHHELGVHMATTLNASRQPLKVFSLGLPGNTFTQEGLAILNEYQSGHMTLQRLRGLALRVLAVKEMLAHNDFRHTYSFLHEEFLMPPNEAFKLALRVHRSGGFTKDYLYLSGVSKALNLSQQQDIRNLYIGKTGFSYLAIIDEMIERQLIQSPHYFPQYLHTPVKADPVMEYLMSCINKGKIDLRKEKAA